MTETEWLSSGDPSSLLSFLHDERQANPRRERLFAVACCNRVGHLILDPRSRNALTVAERFADGLAGEPERAAAHAAALEAAAALAQAPATEDSDELPSSVAYRGEVASRDPMSHGQRDFDNSKAGPQGVDGESNLDSEPLLESSDALP